MRRIKRPTPIVALVAMLAALQVAPAAASSTQEAIFQDDVQLKANPAGTLATLRELGVTRVRVSLAWSTLAPRPGSFRGPRRFKAANPASYSAAKWAPYDRIVAYASADGIGVDLMLTGPAPLWATGPGAPPGGPHGQWKPLAREFGFLVRAVGTRYDGSYRPRRSSPPLPRVDFWSIWNEPNYGVDLAPQATNNDTIEVGAAEYRVLVDAAWSGLHATGHVPSRDTILIGETAPRGVDHPIGNFSGVKPLRFLRALYCVDSSYRELRGSAAASRGCPTTGAGSRRFRSAHPALFEASGFADHPYTSQANPVAPNVPTSSNPSWFRSDPDYADLPEIPRLERTLDELQGIYRSRARLPVWNTEYSYRTRPPDPRAGVSPATAAYYMNWAEYLSWRQSRLRSYDQYLLVDPPRGASFDTGLEYWNGGHKLTFDAYRLPLYLPATSARRGRRLEVWGCARPAHFAALDTGVQQRVAIQFRRGSHGPFRTVDTVVVTNPRGYFDVRVPFTASGSVRLAFTYPSRLTVYSRTVSVRVR